MASALRPVVAAMRSAWIQCQRRIPGHVGLTAELGYHLALVIRVQNVVEIQPVSSEVRLKAVPDRYDFGIVRHRAE
jgi:hypothetical protein